MSTYSTVAYVIFFGSNSFASASRRASGTLATPMRTACRPDARFLVHAGQNREQGGLAHHGQADNGCLHIENVYRGTSTWLRISSMMRSPRSARRCTSVVRVLITTRCANTGAASRLTSSGIAYSRPFDQRQRLHRAVQRLRSARADTQRQRFMRARALDDREHVVDQRFFHRDAMHRSPEAARYPRP